MGGPARGAPRRIPVKRDGPVRGDKQKTGSGKEKSRENEKDKKAEHRHGGRPAAAGEFCPCALGSRAIKRNGNDGFQRIIPLARGWAGVKPRPRRGAKRRARSLRD